MSRKRLGLALSGGSARGLAHVGVLQALERAEISVDCIAGASAGSLVGAAYAAGIRGDQLAELALGFRWRRIARPIWPRDGWLSFAGLESELIDIAGNLTFAELQIPFAAVATDLETGKPTILQDGRLSTAVLASCSIPGVTPPVEVDGHPLIDGGVVNNLPISVTRTLGADVVVAVDLIPPPRNRPQGWFQILFSALQFAIIRASDDPATADVYIPIPLWGLRSLVRLSPGKRLIDLGRQAAEGAMPAIRAALD